MNMKDHESDSFIVNEANEGLKDRKNINYPKEALKLGTFVRSTRLDRLGIITDAFYGDHDAQNQKIIVYTILLLPDHQLRHINSLPDQYYITNEYEYEIVGYLMISPANLSNLSLHIEGEVF